MDIKKLERLKNRFTYPPQNWDRIAELWENNEPISFYSWECPPRQIKNNRQYGKYVNFDINIKDVVNGTKLDLYTEIPRLTSLFTEEESFIKDVVLKCKNATYTKIVADTNGLYLYPRSGKILGKGKIQALSVDFKVALQDKVKELYPNLGFPRIILFTELMKEFKKEYKFFFDEVYRSFDSNLESKLVPNNLKDYWYKRMIMHIGLQKGQSKERLDTLKRAVASYAAEGMIFALISSNKIFPNPVWVNWEEKPESVQSTEITRQRYGIGRLPVIYFVKE